DCYFYRQHRQSFPTRRSSDLPMEITADWTYIRLHGPTQFKYQGSYSDAQLAAWTARIREWSGKLEAIYVYFDNDDSAFAVNNALDRKSTRLNSSHSQISYAVF